MKAIKKLIEVESDKSITVKPIPFKPGSKVEVIVFPAEEEEDIFSYIDEVVKKKKITPMSLRDVEKIVHEVRKGR
jgi:hypothetical protein